MLVGILQCGHAPDRVRARQGDFDRMFETLLRGARTRFQTWNVVDGDHPPGPGAADAWLITGSRHGVYEDHAFIPPLEALIRAIHARKTPLTGICFGHQIIAQALGGQVEKARGGWIVGRQVYDWGGASLALNAWHQDQVVTPPPGARTLAHGPGCPHAALSIADHVLTVQFHPEFDSAVIDALIAKYADTLPAPLLEHARTGLAQPTDSAHIARLIRATLTGNPA